jgi:hypothetical protein
MPRQAFCVGGKFRSDALKMAESAAGSPAPGDSDVTSQVDLLSSSETKIAKIGADSGRRVV